jgi:putative nucleotidyltransferase with HDIG domain
MNSANPEADYRDAVERKVRDERRRIIIPAERYLNGVSGLPSAPALLIQLLALFRAPDPDLDRVVELVGCDPSLTAQILRASNSARFAGEQPVVDMFEAVTRMGMSQVYYLVVSLLAARVKSMPEAGKGVDQEELWRHSVAVSVSASIIAEETGQAAAVAFTAGLLHDIGKLVLASKEGGAYAGLLQKAKEERTPLSALERAALGIDHAELGGELMRRWNLPPDVVAAVRNHHSLEVVPPYQRLTATVQIGDILGHLLFGEDVAGEGLQDSPSFGLLGLTYEDFDRLLGKTQAGMDKLKGLLEIQG